MLHLIAVIVDNTRETIGYRILDSDSKSTKDVSKDAMVRALKSNIQVLGVGLDGNKLIATNGSFDRYAKIDRNGTLLSKSRLVVLFRVKNKGFMCSDYKGNVGTYKEDDVITYCNINGIANGKVVGASSQYISSISGEYPVLETKTDTKKKKAESEKIVDSIPDEVRGLIGEKDDEYRTLESYVAELLHKRYVATVKDLTYDTYVALMSTFFAEEKPLSWFNEEEDVSLVKNEVIQLNSEASFIVEYTSLKIIKAKKLGSKLGKCYVTAIYKEGELKKCYAHLETIDNTLSKVRGFYDGALKMAFREQKTRTDNYGNGDRIEPRLIVPLIDSGYWYLNNDKKKHACGLEVAVCLLDGCCYLVLSHYPVVKNEQTRKKRAFTLLLKFRDLPHGMAYAQEFLTKKFAESVERTDMLEIADSFVTYQGTVKVNGPYTSLLNSYKQRTPVNEELYIKYYKRTSEEMGFVHHGYSKPVGGISSVPRTDREKKVQILYMMNKFSYIGKDLQTGKIRTYNSDYIDNLRIRGELLENTLVPLNNILTCSQMKRYERFPIRRGNEKNLALALIVEADVDFDESNTWFRGGGFIFIEAAAEFMKRTGTEVCGIKINSNGSVNIDGIPILYNQYHIPFQKHYIELERGMIYASNEKKYNFNSNLKTIDKYWVKTR